MQELIIDKVGGALTPGDLEYWQLTTPQPTSAKSTFPTDEKIEALHEKYQLVKKHTIKALQCFEKLYTVQQNARIGLLQDFVTNFRMIRDSLRSFIDLTSSASNNSELRQNGVDFLKYEVLMTTEFLLGTGKGPNAIDFRSLVFKLDKD